MLSQLRKPRWIFLLVLAVGLGSLFVRLGFWQWHKYRARAAENIAIVAGQRAAPVPVQTLVPVNAGDDGSAAFRRVTLIGRYDTAHDLTLYGRTRNEQPGNEVLTPLILADGRVIIINRGWIPFQTGHPDLSLSAPPSGIVHLVGVLEPSETTGTALPPQGLSQVAFVDLGELSSWIGEPVIPYWVHLQGQAPPQATYPKTLAIPPPDGGPYYGYAWQWWFFASLAFLGYPFLFVRELREARRGGDGPRQQPSGGIPAEDARFQGATKEGS
jgi:cytochrome oxidase assembly protein ShyY1